MENVRILKLQKKIITKDIILSTNIGKDLDLLVATELFGIKSIYYEEWNDDESYPYYIPSGKPIKTHQIDAKTLPHVSTSNIDAWLLWERTQYDIIWRIINPDKIEYCVGYSRGKDGDLVCYSKIGDPDNCLSPVCSIFPEAICKTLLLTKLAESQNAKV